MSKSQKIAPIKKVALELLYHRLGHISIISLMSRYTANYWKNIELIIKPEPFFTSCQISSMNKQAISKNSLKPKAPFKWVLIYIIPATAPKRLTSKTTFSNYILTGDAY